MTEAGKKVVAGFVRLDRSERDEVFEAIRQFREASYDEKRSLRDLHEKAAGVIAGPVSTGCPCCGR